MEGEIDITWLNQFLQYVYAFFLKCHFFGECEGKKSDEEYHYLNRNFGIGNLHSTIIKYKHIDFRKVLILYKVLKMLKHNKQFTI